MFGGVGVNHKKLQVLSNGIRKKVRFPTENHELGALPIQAASREPRIWVSLIFRFNDLGGQEVDLRRVLPVPFLKMITGQPNISWMCHDAKLLHSTLV